jgi:hypothetical protein
MPKKIIPFTLNKQNGTNLLNELEFYLCSGDGLNYFLDSQSRRLNRRLKRISPKYFFGHDITPEVVTTDMPLEEMLSHFFKSGEDE